MLAECIAHEPSTTRQIRGLTAVRACKRVVARRSGEARLQIMREQFLGLLLNVRRVVLLRREHVAASRNDRRETRAMEYLAGEQTRAIPQARSR